MNEYFRRYAKKNDTALLSPCLCIVDLKDKSIAGYICLSSSSVKAENMLKVSDTKLPKYPVPVILLSRLAVNTRHQGKGIGQKLLMISFHKLSESVNNGIGAFGMLTQAVDERAVAFYAHHDFKVLDPNASMYPRNMFIHTKTIIDSTK